MNVVMMGVQGSGKGTQSKLLSQRLGLPHISTGDLLRENISAGTEIGLKAKAYTDRGELVPDEIVIDMVRARLAQEDAREGCLLDGFPRSGVQLAALEFLRPVDRAVMLELDDETAIARLGGRSECRKCGIIYGANSLPKQAGVCDKCGEALKIRTDDTAADSVKTRIRLYHQEVEVMVDYYRWKGVLREVDASGTVEEVSERAFEAIEGE